MYVFHLAERLGMTCEELLSRMSAWEFTQWQARDELIAQEQARQNRLSEKGISGGTSLFEIEEARQS